MTNHGIGDWIERRQIKSAGRLAVTAGETQLTYEQFGDHINRLANALTDRGIQQGDRVAYLGENSIGFLETLFALRQYRCGFRPPEHSVGWSRGDFPPGGFRFENADRLVHAGAACRRRSRRHRCRKRDLCRRRRTCACRRGAAADSSSKSMTRF